jgi:hypothetical protein
MTQQPLACPHAGTPALKTTPTTLFRKPKAAQAFSILLS